MKLDLRLFFPGFQLALSSDEDEDLSLDESELPESLSTNVVSPREFIDCVVSRLDIPKAKRGNVEEELWVIDDLYQTVQSCDGYL